MRGLPGIARLDGALAMRVSAAMKSPAPAPKMSPSASATTGTLSRSANSSIIRLYSRRRKSRLCCGGIAATCRMSPPAQNARSPDAVRSRPEAPSSLAATTASRSPSTISEERAFSFEGRLSRTSSTPPGCRLVRSGGAVAHACNDSSSIGAVIAVVCARGSCGEPACVPVRASPLCCARERILFLPVVKFGHEVSRRFAIALTRPVSTRGAVPA